MPVFDFTRQREISGKPILQDFACFMQPSKANRFIFRISYPAAYWNRRHRFFQQLEGKRRACGINMHCYCPPPDIFRLPIRPLSVKDAPDTNPPAIASVFLSLTQRDLQICYSLSEIRRCNVFRISGRSQRVCVIPIRIYNDRLPLFVSQCNSEFFPFLMCLFIHNCIFLYL